MAVATSSPRVGTATEAAQVVGFHTGNEMAALSAKQIDFHLMGYYPITPSTEIAEILDEMKAAGEHDIMMVPADGEHGAAGFATAPRPAAAAFSTRPARRGCCTRSSSCRCSRGRASRCCSTSRRAR